MKYRKFNKYEKKEIQHKMLEAAMAGSGIYIYQNSSNNGELKLPRPTKSGLREVDPGAQFQGDDYYMQMVLRGELRYIRTIQTPEQEKEAQMLEQKLIVEQPDQVKATGTVEQVVAPTPTRPMTEADNAPQPDVLLVETPLTDGFSILS
jgi:hypothetical protein